METKALGSHICKRGKKDCCRSNFTRYMFVRHASCLHNYTALDRDCSNLRVFTDLMRLRTYAHVSLSCDVLDGDCDIQTIWTLYRHSYLEFSFIFFHRLDKFQSTVMLIFEQISVCVCYGQSVFKQTNRLLLC